MEKSFVAMATHHLSPGVYGNLNKDPQLKAWYIIMGLIIGFIVTPGKIYLRYGYTKCFRTLCMQEVPKVCCWLDATALCISFLLGCSIGSARG